MLKKKHVIVVGTANMITERLDALADEKWEILPDTLRLSATLGAGLNPLVLSNIAVGIVLEREEEV